MLIYLLGAIFLLGILMVVVRGSFQEGTGIDAEQGSLRAGEIQRYGAELQRGVNYILQNGYSESELRFAVPDENTDYGDISDIPGRQVFSPQGGGVEYKLPPSGVNDGTPWQFYGSTHIPNAGTETLASSKAELIAVLPNVTEPVCNALNRAVGQIVDLAAEQDDWNQGCLNAGSSFGFDGTFISGADNNTLTGPFTKTPPLEMCIHCAGGAFHYYKVLLVR